MSPEDLPPGREAREPGEMPRGMPWIVLVVVLAVTGWGAWTFITEIDDGLGPHGDRRTLALLAPPDAEDVDGGLVYTARCVACHQANGSGVSGAFPPLAGSEWVTGAPERPVAIVLHGLQGHIEVAGTAYSSAMPALGSQLSDAEVAAVLTHVRQSFGNDAGPVDAALVAAVREETSGRTGAIAGQAELESMYP